jgi:hypothetical protein
VAGRMDGFAERDLWNIRIASLDFSNYIGASGPRI